MALAPVLSGTALVAAGLVLRAVLLAAADRVGDDGAAAIRRPGRISGGHINPAVSLAMWRLGVFPGVSVLPYVVAQLVGSVLGVLAAGAL
ncbi:aquaporin [Streptomyces sp. NPDC001315]|uniref:aquaporin n=1 Tax=Streptomyces sp. NPDC001315 TaxID=3364562 RepID=UPI00368A889B